MSGSIRQRSENTWEIRWQATDASGRRRQRSATVRGSKRDADARLIKEMAKAQSGPAADAGRVTLSDYLDRWLADYAQVNTRLRTHTEYAAKLRLYVRPVIGSVRLDRLTPAHVQTVLSRMLQAGKGRRTIHHTHGILRDALNYAVRMQLLERNPAERVKPPRVEDEEGPSWTAEQAQQFFACCQDSPYYDLFLFTALTGLRRSEVCGLTWDAVDLAAGTIEIRQGRHAVKGGASHLEAPKSRRSRRVLRLGPEVAGLLEAVKRQQGFQRQLLGEMWTESGYIWVGADGQPRHPDTVTHAFADAVAASALPRLTYHGLRHTFATLLGEGGVDLAVISRLLGHSGVAITDRIYSHLRQRLDTGSAVVERAILGVIETDSAR